MWFSVIGGLAIAQDRPARSHNGFQDEGSPRRRPRQTNRTENMASDKSSVMNAAIGGMGEVEMGARRGEGGERQRQTVRAEDG
jgi:hypothetical protein